jgi:hypothetical protein
MDPGSNERETATPEQQQAYRIGAGLYASAIIFAVWLSYFYGGLGKSIIPIMGAIAIPMFALALAVTLPKLYSVGPTVKGAPQIQVGWILLICGYALRSTSAEEFELVSWWPLLLVALIGGLILAAVICRRRYSVAVFLVVALFASAYISGSLVFINCLFDYSEPRVIAVAVPERSAPSGYSPRDNRQNRTHMIVRLDPPGPLGVDQVGLDQFYDVGYSGGICFRMYRGALFLAWYTVDQYADCPGKATNYFGQSPKGDEDATTDLAEQACAMGKGELAQCSTLCLRDAARPWCVQQQAAAPAEQSWWLSHPNVDGKGSDGRYQWESRIFCKPPARTEADPRRNAHAVDHVRGQFRNRVTGRVYASFGEAASAVCAGVIERQAR